MVCLIQHKFKMKPYSIVYSATKNLKRIVWSQSYLRQDVK